MDRLEQAVINGTATTRPDARDDPDGIERRTGAESLLIQPYIDPSEPPAHPGGGRAHEATRTGPKGVLQDFQAARSDYLRPKAVGSPTLSGSESDQDGGDSEAIEAYRRARMAELRRTPSNGVKIFGHLREIGFEQFDDAVLGEPRGVKVVLLLYEPHIVACTPVLLHLASLARQYPRTKFLRARATALDFATEMADDVLPTLLVYDDGNLVANMVAVDHQWDQRADVREAEIEELLLQQDIIDKSGSPQLGSVNTTFHSLSV